ncbi:alpha-2-macroglobulin family protein [Bacillus sp. NP157]|nr:alpha-2-macroglobulin family protein [Bacillus sp. NP157]
MDLLRFIAMLPVRLLRGLGWLLGFLLRPLFGNVAWSAPAWVPATGRAARQHPLKFTGSIAGALALVAAGWFGWHWWVNRPKAVEPNLITLSVVAPSVTDYTTVPAEIHPLLVRFSGSAARIEALGKPVTDGIAMEPKLGGQWKWSGDHTLVFTPASDWPVGRKVDVRFDKAKVFAPQARLADDHVAFETAPFTARVVNGEFYQDPQDPTRKKTIIQVGFNYPVDAADFEKRIALDLRERDAKHGDDLKFSVTYDEHRLNAFVHSQPLQLPRDDGSVGLKLADGVHSSRGGDGTDKALETTVRVPGLYSLKLDDVQATLVDNARFEPEQVVVMQFSGAVSDNDLAKRVHVWVVPKDSKLDAVDQIGDAELRTLKAIKPEVVPTENDWAESQSFKYHAQPGDRLYVRVDKGMASFGGYVMPTARADLLTVPDYPRLLRFMSEGSLLSLTGDRRVSVVSRNMPGMRVEVGRVLPEQLQHLVSMNEGTFAKPQMYGLSTDDIAERFVKKLPIADEGPGKAHYEGFDLGQYLASGKRGVFLLKLAGYDPQHEKELREQAMQAAREAAQREAGGDPDAAAAQAGERFDRSTPSLPYDWPSDERLVVITDLGVISKRSADGSRDVFVQSIHGGQPVSGASVAVIAKNGTTLLTQATGADGRAHFAGLDGFTQDKQPAMFVVRQGDDLSFLPVAAHDRELDFSRFDVGGDANPQSEGRLSGYLFSDRGIYRPGDLFHIGIIVRASSWTRSVAGIPLVAQIVDPRGTTVRQQAVSMDAAGFAELDYTTAETSPTGNWTVNLYIAKDGKPYSQIGDTTVQVKEFQPDRMKVSAKLSTAVAEGWVKPAQLKAVVDVQNLFGTPAAGRRVEGSLTLRPAFPSFPSYKDYHFYDIRRAKDGFEEKLADGKTDDKGHAEFALDLSRYADATYQLYFLAKAYEAEGGRSVAAATQGMVSSNDWLVGYRAPDNLDYVSRDAERKVNLVAINPEAKRIDLPGLKQAVVETRYVSVLTKQDSGVYKYESKARETTLSETPLTIPAAGVDVALPTDKPGNFALVVKNADGKEVNRVAWSVAGEGNVSRSLERNAELQLTLSKKDYAPGEAVDIAIRAPYAGSGLITIERDKVYAHAWFHADTTSSVQHITVPAGFEGNGYINVQYVRDPSSDEIFMSPLSFGVVPFSVNMDARRASLKVEAPALVKPGDEVTFHVTSTAPTRAVVFAVDEGILQVARYKLGDPLEYFFRKRMLEVSTAQILDLIIPDFTKLTALSAPGGDAEGAIGRQLNPFRRKQDKPVAYWSGIVDIDGSRDLSWKVPDYFNGKLRVMAVAVSSERVGTYEGATTVRGDFVLSPNVPTTLAPGDEAEVSVGVANNLTGLGGKTVPVAVTLKVGPQLQVVGEATKTLDLGEMREGAVTFRVRATDKLGSAHLAFSAGANGKSAKQGLDLSVRPASPFRTELAFGHVDAHARSDVQGLRDMHDAYARRDAAFSSVPVVLARGLAAYLVDFPHYCTEQVISAAMPALILGSRPEFGDVKPARMPGDAAAPADPVAALFDTLRARQNGQGGFGLWTATPDTSAFATDYAVHYLLEAGDRGVAVPRDMLDAANKALRQIAADDSGDGIADMRERAYAIYLLTRQGTVTTNDLASLQRRLQDTYATTWKNDVAAAWLASSYRLLHQDKVASDLMAGPRKLLTRKPADEAYEYADYYDPGIRDATVLYLLAKHFPEMAKDLPPSVVDTLVRPLGKGHYNTLSSSMVILALDAWAKDGGTPSKLSIGSVAKDGAVTSIGAAHGVLLSATFPATAQRLRLVNDSDATAWYGVAQAGFDRVPSAQVRKDGLEITRSYTDTKGNPVTTVGVGDEVDVHVRIRATTGDGVPDIAITDLLPGGFEPALDTSAPATPDDQAAASTDEATSDSDANESDEGTEGDANGDGADAADGDADADATPAWHSPIGNPESTWKPEYADVREDRVVVYGFASSDVQEFIYRIKATNAGKFMIPPAQVESLYDRGKQATAPGGGSITVEAKP